MKQKARSLSPLREAPVRTPAESTERYIDKLINDDAMFYAVVGIVMIVLGVLEWFRFVLELPPSPRTVTAISVVVVSFCSFRFFQIKKKLAPLRLGREGEKLVGQSLELLREQGAKVFHDIPAPTFNLDHVVISTTGIFVIETKTYSKPGDGQGKLHFDGMHITSPNGYRSD